MKQEEKLSKDADIYQKRAYTYSKQEFWRLPLKEKLTHIKDYYTKIILFVVIALISSTLLIYSMSKPKSNIGLYTVVLNDDWNATVQDEVIKDLSPLMNIDTDEELRFNTQFHFEVGGIDEKSMLASQTLTTYLFNEEIDVMICDSDSFDYYARRGYLLPLEEILPDELRNQLNHQFYSATIDDETTAHDYGLSLSTSSIYDQLSDDNTEHILSIVASTEQTERAITLIQYFFGM